MPPVTKPLTADDLGAIVLKTGDNDAQRRWGGQVQHGLTGTPVRQVQDALVAVGLLAKGDGAFGHHTQLAVKQFQWYLKNIGFRLKLPPGAAPPAGTIMRYSSTVSGMPGACDKGLAKEILGWQEGGFLVTTPLVRLSTTNLANVETGDGFKVLPPAGDDDVIVHADFGNYISSVMNDEAKKLNVILSINQTFRPADVPVSGAVVTPATKSQHLIGHAVDLNIHDGSSVNSAANYKTGAETDAADAFVKAMKANGLRWGGDFADHDSVKYDPIHYDDYVNPGGEDFAMNYFFAQRSFKAMHPMRKI